MRFFKFPLSKPERAKKWIAAMKRAPDKVTGQPWQPSKNVTVCEQHFQTGQPSRDPEHPDYAPNVFEYNKRMRTRDARIFEARKKRAQQRALNKMIAIRRATILASGLDTGDYELEVTGMEESESNEEVGAVAVTEDISDNVTIADAHTSPAEHEATPDADSSATADMETNQEAAGTSGNSGTEQDTAIESSLLQQEQTNHADLLQQLSQVMKENEELQKRVKELESKVAGNKKRKPTISYLLSRNSKLSAKLQEVEAKLEEAEASLSMDCLSPEFLKNDETCEYYTGLPTKDIFDVVLQLVLGKLGPVKTTKLQAYHKLLICLMKLRYDYRLRDLADRFRVKSVIVEQILARWTPVVQQVLRSIVIEETETIS